MNVMRIFQWMVASGAVAMAIVALPGRPLFGAAAGPSAAAVSAVAVVKADAAAPGQDEGRVFPLARGVLFYEAPTVYVTACSKAASVSASGSAQASKCS